MKNAFALLFLLAPLAAQTVGGGVELNGVVQLAGAPTICPGHQYVVAETAVQLDGSLVDLAPFAGKLVHLSGTDVTGSCVAPIVQVTAVSPATATLAMCGTVAGGCPLRLKVGPSTISQNWLAFSLAPEGFLNLGATGVLFLGNPLFVLGSTGAAGTFDVSLPPAGLIGATIRVQGLHWEVGPIGPPPVLTNPLALKIALGPACFDPTSCGF